MLAQIFLVEGWTLLLMEHTFMSQLGDINENTGKPLNSGVKVIEAATNIVMKKIKLLGEPSSWGKFIGGPQYHMTVAASGSGKVISKKLTDIDCGGGGTKCEADFYVNRKVQLQAIR